MDLDVFGNVGSFPAEEVRLLLTDLTARISAPPRRAATREYVPSPSYVDSVGRLLSDSAGHVAQLSAVLAERIHRRRPSELVLVSIVRAGVPAGILVRRWLRFRYGREVPHFGISSAGPWGIDDNAIRWLGQRYPPESMQFVDGWTSKGTVQRNLRMAVERLCDPRLDPELAVLADTGWCTTTFATRDDVLFPHACLGAFMSGMLSSPVATHTLLGGDDFHGIQVYTDGPDQDLTNRCLDVISAQFPVVADVVGTSVGARWIPAAPDHRGPRWARYLAGRYGATDLDVVNVGISESMRAFFRRVPRLLVLGCVNGPDVGCITAMAVERGVRVVLDADIPFRAMLL